MASVYRTRNEKKTKIKNNISQHVVYFHFKLAKIIDFFFLTTKIHKDF